METDLSHMPSKELGERITELSARIAASCCQWLLMIAEFDRRQEYLAWECQSMAHWLNWRGGLSIGPARERLG